MFWLDQMASLTSSKMIPSIKLCGTSPPKRDRRHASKTRTQISTTSPVWWLMRFFTHQLRIALLTICQLCSLHSSVSLTTSMPSRRRLYSRMLARQKMKTKIKANWARASCSLSLRWIWIGLHNGFFSVRRLPTLSNWAPPNPLSRMTS